MVDLGPSQKPIVMPSYPHLLAEDTDVWSRYLADPLVPIREVWYDVHVGAGIRVGVNAGEIEKKVAAGVGRKRIDCICRIGGGYWVVEIKPFGSMLALGQVLSYHRLFVAEYAPAGEAWPVIVCYQADRDLLDQFDIEGVAVIEVGRPAGL